MAEAAKSRDKPLMLSPKALEKALASSGLRARRLAEAFGQKVPGTPIKLKDLATKPSRKT